MRASANHFVFTAMTPRSGKVIPVTDQGRPASLAEGSVDPRSSLCKSLQWLEFSGVLARHGTRNGAGAEPGVSMPAVTARLPCRLVLALALALSPLNAYAFSRIPRGGAEGIGRASSRAARSMRASLPACARRAKG